MNNYKNKNAFIGKNNEELIRNSIADHPSVIQKLIDRFNIKGIFENTAGGGIYGDKSDVRINFTCGRYIDANIKSYRVGFNQLRRTTVSKFCDDFNLSPQQKDELEFLVVEKSKNTKNPLFPIEKQKNWGIFFRENAKDILKWGFSEKQNREILILYDMYASLVKIYHMKDVLQQLPTEIIFTKGGLNIGNCITFQRKGGNGSYSKNIPKTTIQHPGNHIQFKIKIAKLISNLEQFILAEYSI